MKTINKVLNPHADPVASSQSGAPATSARALPLLVLVASLASTLPAAGAAINIVATLPDYGAIAQAIGGDLVKVTAIARGTEDPHFVDARPSFITVLNKADVLLEGGLELEVGWLPPLLNSARNPKILAGAPGHIQLSQGVRVLDIPAGPVDRSMGDVHPLGNPHFWLDPANGKIMAATLAATLARLDPAHAAAFETNRANFDRRLDEKLERWTRQLEPFRGTKVFTYHKSFDYFLARFGLELAGTIEPKPGIEPSPTHIAALIPRARELGVKLVIIEPNRPHRTPAYIAEAIGARLVVLPAMVGGQEKIKDYLDLFDYDVAQIVGPAKP
jgi:ABC-type Zn uptake system ZnuABC Zn-binding protein ZnuA